MATIYPKPFSPDGTSLSWTDGTSLDQYNDIDLTQTGPSMFEGVDIVWLIFQVKGGAGGDRTLFVPADGPYEDPRTAADEDESLSTQVSPGGQASMILSRFLSPQIFREDNTIGVDFASAVSDDFRVAAIGLNPSDLSSAL